eukprot:2247518-Rhodomonas_salina.1
MPRNADTARGIRQPAAAKSMRNIHCVFFFFLAVCSRYCAVARATTVGSAVLRWRMVACDARCALCGTETHYADRTGVVQPTSGALAMRYPALKICIGLCTCYAVPGTDGRYQPTIARGRLVPTICPAILQRGWKRS